MYDYVIGRIDLLCEYQVLYCIERSISNPDLGIILAYSAISLAEIEGLLNLLLIRSDIRSEGRQRVVSRP